MVGVQGLEPWASRSQIQRSTKLSYTPKYGTPCWTQTNDTWLRRPLLCSTELMGHIAALFTAVNCLSSSQCTVMTGISPWRRQDDSNARGLLHPSLISSQTPSATWVYRHIKANLRQLIQLSLSLLNEFIINHLTTGLQLCNTILIMFLSTKVHNMYLLLMIYGRGSRIRICDAGVWSRQLVLPQLNSLEYLESPVPYHLAIPLCIWWLLHSVHKHRNH